MWRGVAFFDILLAGDSNGGESAGVDVLRLDSGRWEHVQVQRDQDRVVRCSHVALDFPAGAGSYIGIYCLETCA